MAKIDENKSINYLLWQNPDAVKIAQNVDNDGIQGLSNTGEIFNFVQKAIDEKFQKSEINELLGLQLSRKPLTRAANSNSRTKSPKFQEAINNYNKIIEKIKTLEYSYNYEDMQTCDNLKKVIRNINDDINAALQQKLFDMEQGINKAFEKCEAYQKILIVPQRYFRYFPYINSYLDSFDIEEIRNTTTSSMNSLQTLKQDVEDIIAKSNGTKAKEASKTQYDVEELAKKYLGMSYAEFARKNSGIIEKSKTMTIAGMANLSPQEADAYSKLKAYAKEMLQITYNEAHSIRWDVGERKIDETFKATMDVYTISEFEYEGITDSKLNAIESGITYSAIEETLTAKNNELKTTGIKDAKTEKDGIWKESDGHGGLIIHKNGKTYNAEGRRIK